MEKKLKLLIFILLTMLGLNTIKQSYAEISDDFIFTLKVEQGLRSNLTQYLNCNVFHKSYEMKGLYLNDEEIFSFESLVERMNQSENLSSFLSQISIHGYLLNPSTFLLKLISEIENNILQEKQNKAEDLSGKEYKEIILSLMLVDAFAQISEKNENNPDIYKFSSNKITASGPFFFNSTYEELSIPVRLISFLYSSKALNKDDLLLQIDESAIIQRNILHEALKLRVDKKTIKDLLLQKIGVWEDPEKKSTLFLEFERRGISIPNFNKPYYQ